MTVKSMTLAEAIAFTGREVYDYLDREELVPVVGEDGGTQGDVSIRFQPQAKAATTPLPKEGVIVVSGENGHTHTLAGGGFFDRNESGRSMVVGTLSVPEGATVILDHMEHGDLLIAPGTYAIGSQREYAGEWHRVAD